MSKREEIKKLTDRLNEYNRYYYEQDNPKISDREYDMLLKKLEKLEEEYPEFKLEYSPTQRVGGKALDEFEKVRHKNKQLSLDNSYSLDDLLSFEQKVKDKIEKPEFVLENKFDGLTVVLTYERGNLVLGATRGDGVIGENVTLNVKTIKSIPLKLKEDVSLIVRGEVIIYKDKFNKINENRKAEGKPLFANPRNMAAGSIRLLIQSGIWKPVLLQLNIWACIRRAAQGKKALVWKWQSSILQALTGRKRLKPEA